MLNTLPFFYDKDCRNNIIIKLNDDEAKHAIKSLRLRKEDRIIITNGKGQIFEGIIIDDNIKNATIKIIEEREITKPKYNLHIAIAILHQAERFEWFIEKAVEIGISEITPLITQRTEKKSIKIERLQKVAISALKQSRQSYLPKINNPMLFNDFMHSLKPLNNVNKAIAACIGTNINIKNWLKENKTTNAYIILIGPEGDFSDYEINEAINNNFVPINLGNSVLRSETAGVFVCSLFRNKFI
jgi:16S rRNA (uracil1498-N3)-methyltransferase